ncbi:UDP-N-acetylmuramate dehydrogenase [Paenibacillus dakarensis]|uniref:UDP-N-acetylmuramate dehydrogenase n=1 Tax=Paenibacillus dakarensis TaxID=1527293 RepID=UPI0006D542D5|nr:FAD-binding protein [Paenibacillus dakarensis]
MSLHTSAIERLCLRDIPLSSYSTYGIGGAASYTALPETVEDLTAIYQDCLAKGLSWYTFGMGSNILFPDQPDPDTVFISLKKLTQLNADQGKWFVSSGTPMSMLSLLGLSGGIDDHDFTFLLPGCLGAGIYMNAKYNHRQICDIIDTVYYIDTASSSLSVQSIPAAECEFAYKKSIFQKHPWMVVGADLNIPVHSEEQIRYINSLIPEWKARGSHPSSLPHFFSFFLGEVHALAGKGFPTPEAMLDIIKYRTSKKHFDYPSCGSVFKNNYDFGVPIGSLVDQLNLKGTEHGGAIISPHHGNMILNQNHATAADIRYLMDVIMEAIDRKFGFVPEPEIVIV